MTTIVVCRFFRLFRHGKCRVSHPCPPDGINDLILILIFLQRTSIKEPKSSGQTLSFQSHDLDAVSVHSAKSNLWSHQAREDIYNRRQNGEEWETICKVGLALKAHLHISYQISLSLCEGLSNSNTPCDATAVFRKPSPEINHLRTKRAIGDEETQHTGKDSVFIGSAVQ